MINKHMTITHKVLQKHNQSTLDMQWEKVIPSSSLLCNQQH